MTDLDFVMEISTDCSMLVLLTHCMYLRMPHSKIDSRQLGVALDTAVSVKEAQTTD